MDAQDRCLDHHAIGVDGYLLHLYADDLSPLQLYPFSYERHGGLNHFVLEMPAEWEKKTWLQGWGKRGSSCGSLPRPAGKITL